MFCCTVLIAFFKSSATALIIIIVVCSCTKAISINPLTKTIETNPVDEEFLLPSDDRAVIEVNAHDSKLANRIFTLFDIPSTTCKTITKSTNHTPSSTVLLGKRSINEINDDTDLNRRSKRTYNDEDFDSFLTVDEEQLSEDLINAALTTDGSGDTTEPTLISSTTTTSSILLTSSVTTSPTTSTNLPIVLSGISQFLINATCSEANGTLAKIQQQLNGTIAFNITNVVYPCARSLSSSDLLNLTINTDNNIRTLNNLFSLLYAIVSELGQVLISVGRCGSNDLVKVENVTACYLIELCNLCGDRGRCELANNVTKCECYNNSTITYTDDLCSVPKENPLTSTSNSWTLIVVGVLAGSTGLFCTTTSCLLFLAIRRRRRQNRSQQQTVADADEVHIHRSWHLPRIQPPTAVTNENMQTYLDYSVISSDQEQNDTMDSSFFHELDQQLQRNRSLSSTNSPLDLTSSPSISYDPIVELDAILDDDTSTNVSNEALYQLSETDGMVKVVNPNYELPTLNIDS